MYVCMYVCMYGLMVERDYRGGKFPARNFQTL